MALPSWALPGLAAPGMGRADGSSWAEYRLAPLSIPPPPDYANDGFEQRVTRDERGWGVRVDVRLSPAAPGAPFSPAVIPDLGVPLDLAADLAQVLSPCRTVDEAVGAVMLLLRRHIRYREKVSFEETPSRVFERREASCVGFTRCACVLLRGLGLACREVVGLKLPQGRTGLVLEGGMLHAWIEVDYPGSGSAFSDPLTSSGWVSAQYVVLRRGGGLEVGELAALKGATVRCENARDRIFFEPDRRGPTVLWALPDRTPPEGSLLSGKLLSGAGAPLSGKATLASGGVCASMALWEGNFFFQGLDPGTYRLTLSPRGEATREVAVQLGSRERRYLIFLKDGPWKAGALDEPGR